MKHAHIIPLVGGSVIGTERALKTRPEYIASWEAFAKNDSYCRQYYKDVPFHLVDKGIPKGLPKVDILTCVPPCSGLSNATTGTRGCQAPQNQHMLNVAEFGMQQKTPAILIENAPMLYSDGGYEFFVRFVPLAEKYGYTIQLMKTSTILHGLPQNRVRTFVMLWRGDKQPLLNWIDKPYVPLTEWPVMDGVRVFDGKASDDEMVQKVLKHYGDWKGLWKYMEALGGGPRTSFTLLTGIHPPEFYKFKTQRYKDLFERASRKAVLDVTPTFVRTHTNALMWKVTTYMVHPTKDRFISIRELMNMMGLPKDYPEIPKNHMNVIFQNVPVTTVETLVTEMKAALEGKREWIRVPFMKVNNIKKTIDSKAYTLQSLYFNEKSNSI
jgi:site-specific DNA-cytosine methylase